jgi:hypothetical protein
MKGLLLEYKYRILESGIKYVIWILFILQLIIGFFGFGAGGAVLSALLVIQINDTMIDDQACGWNQYRKILPVSGRKQVGMRYLLGITATAIMTIIFLIGRALGVFNVEVSFYEVKQAIQWIIAASFLCMSIQIPVNLMLHLKNIRNRLVGLPLVLVCYVCGRLIFYVIRKMPQIPESHVFLKNAAAISIGVVLISYIASILMWKYRK